jgi:hypothetical protein
MLAPARARRPELKAAAPDSQSNFNGLCDSVTTFGAGGGRPPDIAGVRLVTVVSGNVNLLPLTVTGNGIQGPMILAGQGQLMKILALESSSVLEISNLQSAIEGPGPGRHSQCQPAQ